MGGVKRWVLALALAALFAPEAARAYCLNATAGFRARHPDFYGVAQEYRRARYVAIVRVKRETWLDPNGKPTALRPPFQFGARRPWGFDPYMGVYYDVAVLTPFKGAPPARLRLFSENSPGRFWMSVGRRYIAFIGPTQTDDLGTQLAIDNCGNSKPVTLGPVTLRTIKALAAAERAHGRGGPRGGRDHGHRLHPPRRGSSAPPAGEAPS